MQIDWAVLVRIKVLGMPYTFKTDDFSEKFRRGGGGGHFQSKNIILQIFAIKDDTLIMNFGKICNMIFRKFIRFGGAGLP